MGENKIFVAVGKEVEERKSTLKWALKKSKGEIICVVYVHVPSQMIPLPNGFQAPISSVQEAEVVAFREQERNEAFTILDDCLQMCAKYQVTSEKIYVEKESITDGILELIIQLRITKLVMGAAAHNRYSRSMRKPMSKKANYVLNCAPDFCRIWFICKGRLIYMREGAKHPNQHVEENQFIRFSYSEPLVYSPSVGSFGSSSLVTHSMCLDSSPASILLPSIINEDLYKQLQQALADAEILRQEAVVESERLQKAEKDAIEAILQVRAVEEELKQVKMELKDTKIEVHKYSQTLVKVANKISSFKESEGNSSKKNIEEPEALKNRRKKHYNTMQKEYDFADERIHDSKIEVSQMPSSSHALEFSCDFTLQDLEEATGCFDPSLRIGKGVYGSIYKGFLYHTEVAIKILRPTSLQVIAEFKQEVNVLSKLHHPNVVTLIGACPDSLALIYEYLPNRSLEDRLSCKDNTPPLPWQTRIQVVTDICSVLNFLHSIQPFRIIHGDLNPKNIILDANFSCKLSGFGSCHIISKNSHTLTTKPKGSSCYMDPELLKTGHLSLKSDVYSFGIILLQLLTGKPALRIVEQVQHALDNDSFHTILDPSGGDWPVIRAKQLAYMALKCCNAKGNNRPDLGSEVWSVLKPVMTPSNKLCSPVQFVNGDPVPSYFICPIFQEIMRDPHFAADGFTYEADALRGWFEGGHDTSPMTNLKLENHNLTPNRALRSAIQEWLQQHQHK